jgi:hypothetical protein
MGDARTPDEPQSFQPVQRDCDLTLLMSDELRYLSHSAETSRVMVQKSQGIPFTQERHAERLEALLN